MADGVSKLLIRLVYNNVLRFSIEGNSPNDLSDGTIASLITFPSIGKLSSPTVDHANITNGNSVIVAVYTHLMTLLMNIILARGLSKFQSMILKTLSLHFCLLT